MESSSRKRSLFECSSISVNWVLGFPSLKCLLNSFNMVEEESLRIVFPFKVILKGLLSRREAPWVNTFFLSRWMKWSWRLLDEKGRFRFLTQSASNICICAMESLMLEIRSPSRFVLMCPCIFLVFSFFGCEESKFEQDSKLFIESPFEAFRINPKTKVKSFITKADRIDTKNLWFSKVESLLWQQGKPCTRREVDYELGCLDLSFQLRTRCNLPRWKNCICVHWHE